MKMKKWLKCLLMTMALIMTVNLGMAATAIPSVAKTSTAATTVKKGTKFWNGKLYYKVTSLDQKKKKGTVTLVDADTSVKSVTVPKTVKKGKYTLTVTEIGANAFKGCTKLEKVVTNTKIEKIGKNAFSGCKKLKTIDIKSRELKIVGKDALKEIASNAVVKVPEGKAADYKKKLKVSVQAPETKTAKSQSTPKTESAPKAESTPEPADVPAETAPGANDSAEAASSASAAAASVSAPQTEAPKTVQTEAPKAVQTEAPKAVQTEAPKAVQTEAAPKAVQTEALKVVQTEAPKAVQTEAAPKATQTEASKAVQTEAPKAVQTEAAPKAAQTEASKAVQTEAPKKVQTQAAPKKVQTQAAPKAAQTEAPKAVQTEAPKAAQTEAPKAVQTEAPKTVQTEAPKAAQTEAPKVVQTETETPETKHVCEFTWVVTKEPYCGYLGYDMTWRDTGEKVGTCSVCGKTVKKGLRVEEHQFEEVQRIDPTCEKGGEITFKCSICGYRKTETSGEALGHAMEHHEEPVTCTTDGRSYNMCSRCGLVENETITATKTGHDFTSGQAVVVKEATCTQDGQREIACAHEGCTEKKSERIPAAGHAFQTEEIPATCSQDRTIVTTCANCNYRSTEAVPGTRLEHSLVEEAKEPSTTTTHGYERFGCTKCGYIETRELPLVKCVHDWQHVTGQPGDQEGALASMSNGKIRTERCSLCQDMRFAYNIEGENWVPWSEVPCNGQGHTWGEQAENGHVYCSVCGTTKPEGSKVDPATGMETNSRARIVWDAAFCAAPESCVGFRLPDGSMSYSAVLTAISSDHCIKMQAPEARPGYTFEKWTWSHDDGEIPENLFVTNDDGTVDRTTLLVSCDYMNMTFTARYSKTAEASLQEPDPTEIPEVIHAEEYLDISGEIGAGLSAGDENSVQEQDIVEHVDPVVEPEAAEDIVAEMEG